MSAAGSFQAKTHLKYVDVGVVGDAIRRTRSTCKTKPNQNLVLTL